MMVTMLLALEWGQALERRRLCQAVALPMARSAPLWAHCALRGLRMLPKARVVLAVGARVYFLERTAPAIVDAVVELVVWAQLFRPRLDQRPEAINWAR